MAVLKLESSVQSLLVHDVVVVAGVERIGTRLADRVNPSFLPFAWLPAEHPPAPPHPPPGTPVFPAIRVAPGESPRRSAALPTGLSDESGRDAGRSAREFVGTP